MKRVQQSAQHGNALRLDLHSAAGE
jgi:hypothetical protein